MQNPKIFLITDTYWPIQGGVEETVRTLAAGLPSPLEPVIVTHAGPRSYGRSLHGFSAPRPFAEYLDPAGRRVMPLLPGGAGRLWLFALRAWDLPGIREKSAQRSFDALYRFYRKAYFSKIVNCLKSASVVHCFSTGYLTRCTSEACTRLDVPLVLTPAIHFDSWGDSPRQIAAYATADAIICPTGHFRQQLLDRMSPRHTETVVIPPFIREPAAAGHAPEGIDIPKPFVLFLGRREPYKGLGTLLDALPLAGRPVDLVIAGPERGPRIRRERVIDLGEVDGQVKQWLLANCALFCVPSENESFGMVYAEAMQSGKPVVALSVPALRELVEDGVTGLLVPPGNTGALAAAITRIVSDHELQARMGEAARERFEENYAGKKSMEKIVAVYKRVLSI
jgi:glycosyltransferase involved in cell wall biosynthesis